MANFANRFALLGDEDEAPSAPAPTPAPAPTKSNASQPQADKPAGRGGRGGRGGGAGRGAPRNAPRDGGNDSRPPADEGPVGDDPVKDDRGGTGRGRGRGRGGARGARGAPRGGARDSAGRPDRHSQTDTVDSEKKEHQGWGGDEGKREMEDEDWGATDAKLEAATATPTKAGAATPTTAAAPVDAPEPEPEDNSKTYEEYLAERAAASGQPIGGTLNARKANEGSDESQWKNGVALTKQENDNFFIGKTAQTKARKAKEDKRQFLEIEPTFAPRREEGGRGGRGGRGGPRGGRGGPRGGFGGESRGRGRGGRSSGADVNFADTSAFPSL